MQPASENPYPRQRNPRACETCRTSKSRCFASDEPDICQRCLKSRLSCSVRAVARPRRQKKPALAVPQRPNLQTDIALEEETSGSVYIKIKRLPPLDSRGSVSEMHKHHQIAFQKLLPSDDQSSFPLTPASIVVTPTSTWNDETRVESGPSYRNITIDHAEELLRGFQEMKHFFPFVIIPEEATIGSLSRNSPFLLLAMLCAASAKDVQLAYQLDHEFKRVMSEKIVCEGRKSLDYLQGLLIYIAWYPCHLRPKNRQAFLYINLALSILHDLGLGSRDPVITGLTQDNVENDGLYDEDGCLSKAAQRAYLGCYYLSSSNSMGHQKPNGLNYNSIMDEYGTSLSKDVESWSDTSLLPLVRCHYIRERIQKSLSGFQTSKIAFDVPPFQMEMNVQAFFSESEDWKRNLPEGTKSLPHMILAERFLTISVFSHDLAYFRPLSEQVESHLNLITLSRCLEACKKFFEALFSIPASQCYSFTNVEWSNIIQSIIILSRLSFPLPRCPGWDVVAAREDAPLGMYLECLCYRMQALSSVPPTEPNPKAPDGPFIFRMVLESIKRSYEQRIASLGVQRLPLPLLPSTSLPVLGDQNECSDVAAATNGGLQTPGQSPPGRLRCPMNDRKILSFLEPIAQGFNDMFGFPGDMSAMNMPSAAKNIPVYHDLWATMTMNWSDD